MVSLLIKLNLLIKERGKNMTKGMTVAYACAKKVAERLPENKRKSYRQRLTSSLALKDIVHFWIFLPNCPIIQIYNLILFMICLKILRITRN